MALEISTKLIWTHSDGSSMYKACTSLHQVLWIWIRDFSVFNGIPECVHQWFAVSSLGLFLFVLTNSKLLLLTYLIIFYFIVLPLEACLFSNERQKGSGSGWEMRWGGTGRSRGKENHNQDILWEKHIYIFNKRRGEPTTGKYTSPVHNSVYSRIFNAIIHQEEKIQTILQFYAD